jgi:hypothetical protein
MSMEFELCTTRNDATGSVSFRLPESAVPHSGMAGVVVPGGGAVFEDLPCF